VRNRERAPEDRKNQGVDADERQRVDKRPGDAKKRAPVLDPQLTAKEVQKQLSVAEQIGVDRHGRAV